MENIKGQRANGKSTRNGSLPVSEPTLRFAALESRTPSLTFEVVIRFLPLAILLCSVVLTPVF
jgi:hypothetical protein